MVFEKFWKMDTRTSSRVVVFWWVSTSLFGRFWFRLEGFRWGILSQIKWSRLKAHKVLRNYTMLWYHDGIWCRFMLLYPRAQSFKVLVKNDCCWFLVLGSWFCFFFWVCLGFVSGFNGGLGFLRRLLAFGKKKKPKCSSWERESQKCCFSKSVFEYFLSQRFSLQFSYF